jgi:hypothetical protein
MGADFSNHQCFVEKAQPTEVRFAIMRQIQIAMSEMGYQRGCADERQCSHSLLLVYRR